MAEFAGYGGAVAADQARRAFGRDLRQRVYAYWNITDRAGEAPSTSTQDLTFCLPTERDVNSITDFLTEQVNFKVERDLSADIKGDVDACVAADCDPRWVGDGKCDVSCYNEVCRWDGNDCGGPVINSQGVPPVEVPTESQLINFGTGRDACMLKPADLTVAPPGPTPWTGQTPVNGWKFNYWEECNGVGSCTQLGIGQPFTCACPVNCIAPGTSASSYQCELLAF